MVEDASVLNRMHTASDHRLEPKLKSKQDWNEVNLFKTNVCQQQNQLHKLKKIPGRTYTTGRSK